MTAAPAATLRRRTRPTAVRAIPKPILFSALGLLAVIMAVVLVNWWITVKRPQDQAVLQVNSRTFRWSEYIGLLRFQKLAAEHLGGQFQAGSVPYTLMQLMAENEIISQAAAREGLRVTQDDLNKEMTARLVPNAAEITEPAQLDRELTIRLGTYLDAVRLTRAQYEDVVRADLFRRQLREKLGEAIPRVQPQASVLLILSSTEAQEQVAKDLAAGMSFETVARRHSKDPQVESNGGDIGYVPKLVYPDLDNELFGWKEGAVGAAIEVKEGYWLVRVVERVEGGARMQGMLIKDLNVLDNAQRRIREGASFTDLAAELSVDPGTKANRGDLGVVKIGERGKDFDEAIRGVAEGKLIGPALTHDTAFFAIVKKRSPAEEVSQQHFETLKQAALDDWLNKERASARIDYCPGGPDNCFGSRKVDLALAEIATSSLTRAQEATATARARPAGSQG